jgi:hypothetical protein
MSFLRFLFETEKLFLTDVGHSLSGWKVEEAYGKHLDLVESVFVDYNRYSVCLMEYVDGEWSRLLRVANGN